MSGKVAMVSGKAAITGGVVMQNGRKHKIMRIGSFARQAGVSIRTVRYYEELGILYPERRSSGGFRLYGAENLRRLLVINFLKNIGLPLTEIRRILLARQESGGGRETVKLLVDLFAEKLELVESKIHTLRTMKTELANALEILRSCRRCGNRVLLEASACVGCTRLGPEEKVPNTLWALLH